ncbi:MAG TPA: hypothetical protein VF837_01590, partial [Patescibacteria group bacterium]
MVKKHYLPQETSAAHFSAPVTISSTAADPAIKSQPKILPSPFARFKLNSGFSKYIIVASLIIALTGLGWGIYNQAILKAKRELAYSTAGSPIRPGRILSFQGRITDSSGNPISSTTQIEFKLYNTQNVGTGTTLYDSFIDYGTGIGSTVVTPDTDGIFNVIIGKTHGSEIPASVFTENSQVWLEITAGGEVMSPRQQIATVAYALNSETLQGLPPSASGTKGTVMVIDDSGNLNLGETSPTIKSVSGTFGIEGQAVLIKTSTGSGGNITINPDANGIIKLLTQGAGSTAVGGAIEITNANFATGNLLGAKINNDNRGYNFLSFQNYNVG